MKSLFAAASLALLAAADPVADALARMDRNAAAFKGATLEFRQISHNAAVGIDDEQSGTMWLKRSGSGDLRAKIEFREPKPRTIVIDGQTASIYYPRLNLVQEYPMAKYRDLFEQFFLLGFGGTGKELANNYNITSLGSETINSEPATHLQLIPKSPQMLKNIRKVELWLSDRTGYPVQEKVFQASGDYTLMIYNNLKVNPSLPDSSLKLKLPKSVQVEHPQK